jgi:hypothetical protein
MHPSPSFNRIADLHEVGVTPKELAKLFDTDRKRIYRIIYFVRDMRQVYGANWYENMFLNTKKHSLHSKK